ncbi:hypothetical protein C2W62_21435 [Candidatus Entotheonella serta]|nr:hypothetical protein C2W62_21435 [Candidatus Entotheonella serta]
MYLTRHQTPQGPRWALDGQLLPSTFTLGLLLAIPAADVSGVLQHMPVDKPASGESLPPLEPTQEVWASGVTYLRSREARETESASRDVYEKVYDAERPELFFKALLARCWAW